MPQRKAAIKRLRIDKKLALTNIAIKTELKKVIKGFRALIAQAKMDEAKAQLKTVYARIDRAVTKGVLHKNTAARRKSKLALMLNKKV